MTQASIAAVIVTRNRIDKLKTTVSRTLKEPVQHVIIVNNVSIDGTKEWLDSLNDERLRVIHATENLGGAGGFYVGFKEVIDNTDADWLVCFDDDAFPQQDAIKSFRALELSDDIAGVAAAVYLPSGMIAEMNRPSLNPFGSLKELISTALRGRMGFHIDDTAYKSNETMLIDYSSFVGFFVRTKAITERLGLPRTELFIYADDIIYTLGIGKAGLRHVFAPTVRFTHDCGTLVNNQDIYKPMWRAFYSYRNRLEMFRMVSGILFPLIVLIKVPGWILKAKHYDDPITFRRVVWTAVSDGVRRDFGRSHDDVLRLTGEG